MEMKSEMEKRTGIIPLKSRYRLSMIRMRFVMSAYFETFTEFLFS
jgi:hypothetical protein